MSEPREQQERFMNNRLIDKLQNEPYWTVSDTEKRPVDVNEIIKTGKIKLASFKNNNWPLAPLSEINKDPRLLPVTNRAYRLHAEDNRVICIDMEKTASEEIRNALKKFPVDYAETSLSGEGRHYLIEVPEELIPEEAKYLFDDMVVVKSEDGSFEVFFNDHYVTLTKNILPPSEYTLKRIDEEPEHRYKITRMLTVLAEIQRVRKLASKNSETYIPDVVFENLTPYEETLQETIKKQLNPYDASSSFKTLSDFQMDHSRYELYLATSIASRIIKINDRIQKLLSGDKEAMRRTDATPEYIKEYKQEHDGWDAFDIKNENTRQHLAGIVYNTLCSDEIKEADLLQPRSKHNETRNNMPWLMDRAVRGTGFACGQNIQEKAEKEEEQKPQPEPKEVKETDTKSIESYMKAHFGAAPKKGNKNENK